MPSRAVLRLVRNSLVVTVRAIHAHLTNRTLGLLLGRNLKSESRRWALGRFLSTFIAVVAKGAGVSLR